MASEKLSTFYHPGILSAVKSCRKPFLKRLSVSASKLNKLSSVSKTTVSYKSSGAVDEEHFVKEFDVVSSIPISSKDIDIVLEEIRNNICAKDNWDKRVEALKNLRAVIMAYSGKHDSILQKINLLDIPLESSIKDLKSHVVREACITIAFLSVNLQHKFHRFAEVVFTTLMSLIQSSVKVISSSGATCIRFILRNTHNPRLVPILIHHINSKSASLRYAVCEFIDLILYHWKTKLLERHINILKDTIRMGICDANADVRAISRQTFWHFVDHFPEQEKILLNSLPISYKRFLHSGVIRSVSSLNNSVSCVGDGRPVSSESCMSKVHNCEINKIDQGKTPNFDSVSSLNNSISCVDDGRPVSSEACMSKVHNFEINKINQGKTPNFDSSKVKKKEKCLTYSDVTKQNLKENKFPELLNTGSHVVNSRSGCINKDHTFNNTNILVKTKIKHQSTKDISSNSSQSTVNIQQLHKPCNENCIDSNETVQQAECASNKKNSENNNVIKIIMNLSSTILKSNVEGLVDLQIFFQSGNTLNFNDLKYVTNEMTSILEKDITDFTGLLLDTLGELIVCHKKDLDYWLDLLLMHVLNKFSINVSKHFENRLAKLLDIIRDSFPVELQLLSLLRFFKENTHIKNIKAIAIALNYIYILINVTESDSDFATMYIKNESSIIIPILIKIITFAVDKNNFRNYNELRKAATEALLKLYNFNFPLIKLSFSHIPEKYQKSLQYIICGKINNTSANGDNNSLPHSLNAESSRNNFFDHKTVESDEVLKKPQVTKTEVQDFGCYLCKHVQQNNIETVKTVTAKESTKMKNVNNFKEIPFKSESSLRNDTKTHSVPLYFNADTANDYCTVFDDMTISAHAVTNHENELICTALKSLNTKTGHEADKCSSLSDKISALNQLMRLTEETSSTVIGKNFKFLLRTLFDYMSGTDAGCVTLALHIIIRMLKRKDIIEKFNNYSELLIFQLLLLCESKNKQVSGTAMLCVNAVAVTLDPDTVIRISVPLTLTLHFPANVAAVNMITTLIKIKGRKPIEMYVPDLMPTLIKALDSTEVSLRKSALLCIVALYLTVGEEPLKHYLTSLDHGKLKLLMIYIQKAKEKQECLKE